MEILVVEDTQEIGYLLETILVANNYVVSHASNGKKALELLANKKYDMVISDILMPIMDGFQLCKILKIDPKTKSIPFVFYSANYTEKKDIEFALILGADIYIETPIEPDEFINIINDFFDKLKQGIIKPREYAFDEENNVEKIYSERLARQLEKKLMLLEKKIAENNELMKKLKEREEKYRELVENANSIITKYDKDGIILSMNEYGLKFFGYTAEELIGKNFVGTITPPIESTGKKLSCLLSDIFSDLERYSTHINENTKKNGERVWVYWANKPIIDESGNFLGIFSVGTDITDRKMAEEALKQSEEKFRSYVENAPEGIFIADEKGKYVDVNDAACKVTGYTKEELLKMNLIELIPGEDKEKAAKSFAKVVSRGKGSVEISFTKKEGEKRYWIVNAVKLSDTRFLGFTKDISDRKKLEAEIILLHNAVEQSPAIVILTDKKRQIEYVNPKFTEVTGYTSSEVMGRNVSSLSADSLSEEKDKEFWSIISTGNEWRGEFKNKKKNGEIYWELASIAPVKTQGGAITHFVKVAEDITYQKLSEKELKEREETLRGILSAAPIGINLFQNRIFKWSNKGMAEITGHSVEELVGKSPRFLYESDEEYERVGSILYRPPRESEVIEIETKYRIKNGNVRDVYIRTSPLDIEDLSKGYINIVMDITESNKAQNQLEQNLEYFAHLVDHIRNPLAIISGFTQIEVENEKTKDRLMRQIDRIEELIKQLDQGWMDTEDTRRFLKKYL